MNSIHPFGKHTHKTGLLLIFLLAALLAFPAAAHDPPDDEGEKEIHAVIAIGQDCPKKPCKMTWFWVMPTDMGGPMIIDQTGGTPKKAPDRYRICWKPKGKKWLKWGKPNQKNRGCTEVAHVDRDIMTRTLDPHGGYAGNSFVISDQISMKRKKTMKVRIKAIYDGEENGPWTCCFEIWVGGSHWPNGYPAGAPASDDDDNA